MIAASRPRAPSDRRARPVATPARRPFSEFADAQGPSQRGGPRRAEPPIRASEPLHVRPSAVGESMIAIYYATVRSRATPLAITLANSIQSRPNSPASARRRPSCGRPRPRARSVGAHLHRPRARREATVESGCDWKGARDRATRAEWRPDFVGPSHASTSAHASRSVPLQSEDRRDAAGDTRWRRLQFAREPRNSTTSRPASIDPASPRRSRPSPIALCNRGSAADTDRPPARSRAS
jgi:hypothetical protein